MDNRAHPRTPLRLGAIIEVAGVKIGEGVAINISASGVAISMSTGRAPSVGTHVRVQLKSGLELAGRVARAMQGGFAMTILHCATEHSRFRAAVESHFRRNPFAEEAAAISRVSMSIPLRPHPGGVMDGVWPTLTDAFEAPPPRCVSGIRLAPTLQCRRAEAAEPGWRCAGVAIAAVGPANRLAPARRTR